MEVHTFQSHIMMLCRTALGQELDLYNIREMDSGLGISLERFAAAYNTWEAGNKQQPLTIDSQPIEDLCLTFELPGILPLPPELTF